MVYNIEGLEAGATSELGVGRGGGLVTNCPTLPLMRKDETIDPFLEQVRTEESRHSFQTKYDFYRFIYTECGVERLWLPLSHTV